MNKTSHTDEPFEGDNGYNQSPSPLSNDLTTNEDLNGTVNNRALRERDAKSQPGVHQDQMPVLNDSDVPEGKTARAFISGLINRSMRRGQPPTADASHASAPSRPSDNLPSSPPDGGSGRQTAMHRLKASIVKYCSFVGPGFMISVAYIDPGNYATDIAAGASYRFRLLFVVLLSNLIAIFLQGLALKLGTVSGLNLAEACRAFLPRWLNFILYIFAEVAIIATDIAEVIGFAIALNLLIPQIPLVAGCAISILDVMVILFFYRPEGEIRSLRFFEYFVSFLVLGVVICFCIQLSLIRDASPGDVFQGYLPSHYLLEQKALYQACGILGATVMPHSLYLGSGIVQPRLREFDRKRGLLRPELDSASDSDEAADKEYYVPSLAAIRHCLKISSAEMATSLFTFALFVNSAILIVAGAALYNNPEALSADIFGIHDLLSKSISPAAGTIFAVALLLSGVSAGIVCTIAGQMVSEGALRWRMRPALRRLVTRSISITPSIIIAGAVGRSGLDAALNGTQVALSIVLPFVSAPLIYFTCRNKYMTVTTSGTRLSAAAGRGVAGDGEAVSQVGGEIKMANSWYTIVVAVLIWLFLCVMNVANLALLGQS
ncbi:hypothetical protein NLU13_5558 [Sarocladium strictum]|uniref:Manganese transporter SMF1 n=1 Tax=Sarocladium strictum TaxID=5046 RepID=A0AA39L7X2_SARSR|nr:hypothetical protein NLU13_5558 [Sarocladium strictum]